VSLKLATAFLSTGH